MAGRAIPTRGAVMRWCGEVAALGLLSMVLVACRPGSTTPSTTRASTTSIAIAAPTILAAAATSMSVAAAPTATPSTTRAPTVTAAAATPAEVAEAEIRATLDALNTEIWACFAAPQSCKIDALLDRYFTPDDQAVRPIFRDVWQARIDNNQIKIIDGRIDRRVIWVASDSSGQTGRSFHCEVDETFNVASDTPATASTTVPLDLEPGYLRFYYEWQVRPDGSWVITHSEFGGGRGTGEIETGELPSLSDSEIAECT